MAHAGPLARLAQDAAYPCPTLRCWRRACVLRSSDATGAGRWAPCFTRNLRGVSGIQPLRRGSDDADRRFLRAMHPNRAREGEHGVTWPGTGDHPAAGGARVEAPVVDGWWELSVILGRAGGGQGIQVRPCPSPWACLCLWGRTNTGRCPCGDGGDGGDGPKWRSPFSLGRSGRAVRMVSEPVSVQWNGRGGFT